MIKYPKSFHLPQSPGLQNDDRRMDHLDSWLPEDEIVVTEKLDGENTSFHSDNFHARSLDSIHHESRNFAKSIWANVKYKIPNNIQLVFENVFAKHSIFYDNLTNFVYLINGFDKIRNIVLSWDEIVLWSEELGLETAPILFKGKFKDFNFEMPSKS